MIPTPCDNASVYVQRQMVADLRVRGWQFPCGVDTDTREPLTLGMMFDRHAVCLGVCEEFNLIDEVTP